MKTPRGLERAGILEERRNLKMARSAHAYVRGTTLKFYEWVQSSRAGLIPNGPPVWICGDCHVGNLGPIANAKGRVEIAIRDLDQTVIGNPAHDLIRLGLSLATAARGSDLPGITTAKVLERMIEGYDEALQHPARHYEDFQHVPKPVRTVLRLASSREWRHLAAERIEDSKPIIPVGKCFWALDRRESDEIKELFEGNEVHQLLASSHDASGTRIRVVDSAYWIKGCSSLGRLRYAVLVRIGKRGSKDETLCLMDIKEASKAAAPRSSRSMPRNNARRVVEGARNLSPCLGDRMVAARLMGREVFVRELMPQDLKLDLDTLTCSEATSGARFLAGVVGKAHGRQMDLSTRKKWRSELSRHRSKNLAAPSWLWTCVVDLVASHEVAYLEHCRRYALEAHVYHR